MSGSQLGTHICLFKVERRWDEDSGRGGRLLSPTKSYVSRLQPARRVHDRAESLQLNVHHDGVIDFCLALQQFFTGTQPVWG